jgi:hypothetical protein
MTQQWISVKQGLPETDGLAVQVIVNSHIPTSANPNVVLCAALYKGHFYNLEVLADIDFEKDEERYRMKTVSHYMLLPDAPEPAASGPVSSGTPLYI